MLIVPGFLGDVFGYDVGSGKQLWRFRTMPTGTEFGADTWARPDKGANCWGGMSLDEPRGIAYIATGSPKPNYLGAAHLGANLFSDCIIALNAKTGERLWHFQEIEHDIWDLDLPTAPNLVTVVHDGRKIDAVAAVSKIGNTLLLDRVTGKPLFPYRLRRAPAAKLEGEVTARYQPDLELPQPFGRQDFRREDITDRTPEARAFVEQQLARANMGWFEPFEDGKPTAFYGMLGGSDWPGAAFDPDTGRLYVAANHLPWLVTIQRDDDPAPLVPATPGEKAYQQYCAACHGAERRGSGMVPGLRGVRHRMTEDDFVHLLKTGRNAMPPLGAAIPADQLKDLQSFLFAKDRPPRPIAPGESPRYTFGSYQKLLDQEGYPGIKPPWGTLNCIDLNTGRLLWRVPLGEHEELTKRGFPKTGTENMGGATVTAGGLVFCSGTRDNKIRAFSATDGAELWSATLPLHGTAPPASYEANGRQYIVIAATGGGKLGGPSGDAWVAFALPNEK
ncbi:MAG: PQQ-binding-like beta-propeller repeat protein [Lacunisphaera sp.]